MFKCMREKKKTELRLKILDLCVIISNVMNYVNGGNFMYRDIYGKNRQKVGLHLHTNLSDGRLTPEEAVNVYKADGYDSIAVTDHWRYHSGGYIDGLSIIAGVEYDVGGRHTEKGVYHILGLFCGSEPKVSRDDPPQTIVDKIHLAGGLAVLAHPAWSLNTPEMIMALRDIDATEIYNSVSAEGQSFRPDSSLLVDMIASQGRDYPLLATDDAHYYDKVDNGIGYIMAEAETNDPAEIRRAIIEKRFYATQGPEIHLEREGDKFVVRCSPVSHVYFASNTAWCVRTAHGEGITYAEYTPAPSDLFVRAFVVDENRKSAWSNIFML